MESVHFQSLLHDPQIGVAYLLAFESASNLTVSPTENIEYDRYVYLLMTSIYQIAQKDTVSL